ncbi:helix-turn-helix domain-containing protein [Pontibaca methylaminivorans]|uniref:helix-turn-helix domain-containing protein n=1 Tax=Pontibaca methylaminivorans TaxID=515897 RepID=UPI002E0E8CA4
MIDRQRGVPTALGSRIPPVSLIQTLAVAEYLNFRHAANALGVAQSSVSARVKALEEDLGILLFERHARGVRLTEAGCQFVERISPSQRPSILSWCIASRVSSAITSRWSLCPEAREEWRQARVHHAQDATGGIKRMFCLGFWSVAKARMPISSPRSSA